jgi:Initiator Replication protein
MTNKPKMNKGIEALQNSSDFVILNNPLSNPKFVRAISKSETKQLSVKEIYVPKLFFEIASQLKPKDLEQIKVTESVQIEINIKKFAEAIGATNSSNFYTDIKKTAEYLRSTAISFKGNDGLLTTVGILTKTKTDEKGKIIVFVDGELAQKILDVKEQGNFSFLKEYIFGLQNGQSIKLYPFFKSWLNHGKYETGLDRFKEQFGYNTSGYRFWNNFETRVLKSATEEINEKTDIIVTYETTGENLDGLRPRVTGLIFWITSKEQAKALPKGQPHKTAAPQKPNTELIDKIEAKAAPRQEQPQPIAAKTAEPQETTDLELIYKAWKKLNFIDKLLSSGQEAFIQNLVREKGFEEVYNVVIGLGESKTVIKSLAIFYDDKVYVINRGRAKQEIVKQQEKEKKHQEQELQKLINNLNHRYKLEKNKQLDDAIRDISDEQKEFYLKEFEQYTTTINGTRTEFNTFINLKENYLNRFGLEEIAQRQLEIKGLGKQYRQNIFRNMIFNEYRIQIDFNDNDEVIQSTLFEQATEVIEAKPIESKERPQPQKTIDVLPTPIESIEPIIEDDHKSRHQIRGLSTEDVKDMQKVKTPTSIGDMIKQKASNIFNNMITKK